MTTNTSHMILCGFPGAGKTTLGRYLRAAYGILHVDTDELVEEKLGCGRREAPVEAFRKAETEVICGLPKKPPCVVSIGGGALLLEQNKEALRTLGRLVYLQCDFEVLQRRWKTGNLPSFVKGEEAFYNERLEHYRALNAAKIDVTALSLEEAAKRVLELWGGYGEQFLRQSL